MKLQAIFLLVFFITTPFLWWLPRHYAGRIMMLVTSAVYAWFAPLAFVLLMAGSILQWFTWRLEAVSRGRLAKWLPVLIALLPLIVYKIGSAGYGWLIPLGLSYYAFRQIHVAFEIYKGTMVRPTLREYMEYLLFLPVILIGPIHRMPEFQRSMRRRKWDPVMISEGLERILYGLVKICFFGNFIFSLRLKEWATTMSYWPRLYIDVITFTGNAYVQFAGFSDLAIGGGMIWGIKVMENFNAPFMATNMQAFWQRWHISLSSWCRDYVFQPIAGFTRNRWAALIASMLVLALWHEISLRYIVWGALQALLILLAARSRKLLPATTLLLNDHPVGKWIARIWVFHLFAFSCVLIGAGGVATIDELIKKLF